MKLDSEYIIDRLLTTKEVAERLGLCVPHVRALINSGELKAIDCSVRNGRKTFRIRESELERFIESREVA